MNQAFVYKSDLPWVTHDRHIAPCDSTVNGIYTTRFRPQSQKLELYYMSPQLTLGVKVFKLGFSAPTASLATTASAESSFERSRTT